MNYRRTKSSIYIALLVVVGGANSVDAAGDEAKSQDVTFDDIKFEIEKGAPFKRTMLTEKIEKLSDSPIKIRGYILPSFQQKGITQCVLVRDNMECGFGGARAGCAASSRGGTGRAPPCRPCPRQIRSTGRRR